MLHLFATVLYRHFKLKYYGCVEDIVAQLYVFGFITWSEYKRLQHDYKDN